MAQFTVQNAVIYDGRLLYPRAVAYKVKDNYSNYSQSLVDVAASNITITEAFTKTTSGDLDQINDNVDDIVERLGTPVNTGGSATVAAIIGNPSNSDLVARIYSVDSKVSSVKAETDKISAAIITIDDILGEAEEVAHHFHNVSHWFGKSSAGTETDAADDTFTAFQVDSGNNAYGTAVCIIGSSDTPVIAGKVSFDFNKILIKTAQRTEPYKLRFAWGGSEASALTSNHYTEIMFNANATLRSAPVDILMPRIAAGTKVWANCKCANTSGTLDFFIGLHEYDA